MSNKKVRVVWLIVKAAILRNKTKKKRKRGGKARGEAKSGKRRSTACRLDPFYGKRLVFFFSVVVVVCLLVGSLFAVYISLCVFLRLIIKNKWERACTRQPARHKTQNRLLALLPNRGTQASCLHVLWKARRKACFCCCVFFPPLSRFQSKAL